MSGACVEWASRSEVAVSHRLRRRFEPWRAPAAKPEYPRYHRDVTLSARAQAVLGPHGVARFREFWSYPDGWDFGGGGKALSERSVTGLETFVANFNGFGARRPSLFLSEEGHLELAWEDATGDRVELEFSRTGEAILFFSADDEGQTFDLGRDIQIQNLVKAIPH
jgi:hypothetical protein